MILKKLKFLQQAFYKDWYHYKETILFLIIVVSFLSVICIWKLNRLFPNESLFKFILKRMSLEDACFQSECISRIKIFKHSRILFDTYQYELGSLI